MSLLDRVYNQVKSAEESGAGKNFVPGLFLLTVKGVELAEGQKNKNKIWFRVKWEVDGFLGCRHITYTGNGQSEQTTSEKAFWKGSNVNTVMDAMDSNFQGAVNTIWKNMLWALPAFADLTMDQVAEGYDLSDVTKIVEEDLAKGLQFVTEVFNSGKQKDSNGIPSSDFFKHIMWIPLSKYTGRRFWEESEEGDDDL